MSGDPYRFVAGVYDRLFEPLNRGLRTAGMRMLPPQTGMRVLDVGCGTGTHLDVYRRSGCDLHGIDASAAMLAAARRRLGDDADLRLGDATRIPHADGEFDLVVCMLVLHEMDPPVREPVLAEIRRVVRAGGHVLLIDYHPGPLRFPKGWLIRPVITLAEIAAGRRHFRNYRQFLSIGGLPALVEGSGLAPAQARVVAGGMLALHLLRAP